LLVLEAHSEKTGQSKERKDNATDEDSFLHFSQLSNYWNSLKLLWQGSYDTVRYTVITVRPAAAGCTRREMRRDERRCGGGSACDDARRRGAYGRSFPLIDPSLPRRSPAYESCFRNQPAPELRITGAVAPRRGVDIRSSD